MPQIIALDILLSESQCSQLAYTYSYFLAWYARFMAQCWYLLLVHLSVKVPFLWHFWFTSQFSCMIYGSAYTIIWGYSQALDKNSALQFVALQTPYRAHPTQVSLCRKPVGMDSGNRSLKNISIDRLGYLSVPRKSGRFSNREGAVTDLRLLEYVFPGWGIFKSILRHLQCACLIKNLRENILFFCSSSMVSGFSFWHFPLGKCHLFSVYL